MDALRALPPRLPVGQEMSVGVVGMHDDDMDFGRCAKEKGTHQPESGEHHAERLKKSFQDRKPLKLLFRRHLSESASAWQRLEDQYFPLCAN